MNNLATKNASDFTVTENGDAYISQRKAANLLNVNENTFKSYILRTHPDAVTDKGLDANTLQLCTHYYAYESKVSTPEARNFASTLMRAGAKAYIYHEAGYEVEAKKPMTMIEILEQALKSEREKAAALAIAEEKTIQLDESKEWFTIKRVAFANGLNWKELSWRKLKAAGECKKVFDANFPAGVNAYHIKCWETVYPELELPILDYDENTALHLGLIR